MENEQRILGCILIGKRRTERLIEVGYVMGGITSSFAFDQRMKNVSSV